MSHKTKRKPIPRITRKFQLRKGDAYPLDMHVAEILDYAKSERREVTLIRDAIALYWALEQGNIDALYEKFPQYRNGSGGAGQLDEIKALLETIKADIETKGIQSAQPASVPAFASKSVAMPTFDEDADEPPLLLVKKNTDSDAGLMFLKSMGGVQ